MFHVKHKILKLKLKLHSCEDVHDRLSELRLGQSQLFQIHPFLITTEPALPTTWQIIIRSSWDNVAYILQMHQSIFHDRFDRNRSKHVACVARNVTGIDQALLRKEESVTQLKTTQAFAKPMRRRIRSLNPEFARERSENGTYQSPLTVFGQLAGVL